MVREKLPDRDHWNQRYAERPWPTNPSLWLVANDEYLTTPGTALDIAGGTGRNAIWLAARGWDVTVMDVSNVAIELAATRARVCDVPLRTVEADLAGKNLPAGPWNAIMLFHYLDRTLFPMFPEILSQGGIVIGSLATVRNLERNKRPPAPYLLDEGELPGLIDGLELVVYEEAWEHGHHDARFVAQAANI